MSNSPNILVADLIFAAGPIVAQALNSLPMSARLRVAEACESGAMVETRVCILNEAASVRVVLVNLDGHFVELAHVDYLPN